LTINGERHYLWRAVDQDDNVLDILAARRSLPGLEAYPYMQARPHPIRHGNATAIVLDVTVWEPLGLDFHRERELRGLL